MTSVLELGSYRIGEVAAQLGVTARTIRYYEELGLLGTSAGRPKGGHRAFTDADVLRLRELIRLRDLLGLSLEELSLLAEAEEARAELRDRWSGTDSDAERLRIVDEATTHVRRQLDLLRARRKTLDELADELVAKLERLDERRAEILVRGKRT